LELPECFENKPNKICQSDETALADNRIYQHSCHRKKGDVLSFFWLKWREMACQNVARGCPNHWEDLVHQLGLPNKLGDHKPLPTFAA